MSVRPPSLTGQCQPPPGLKETAETEPIRHHMFARQVNEHLDMRRLADTAQVEDALLTAIAVALRRGFLTHELENGLVHMPIDDGADVPGWNGLRHHLRGQMVRLISLSRQPSSPLPRAKTEGAQFSCVQCCRLQSFIRTRTAPRTRTRC